MGNVGIGELALLGLLVLLVFGPNKLPEIMRNLGKAYRVFQEESQKAASVLREGLEGASKEQHAPGVIDKPDEQPSPAPEPPSERAHEDT
jgi:sec-independent protein translocase protein TatA